MADSTSIGELVRKAETDYTHGTTHVSKYVDWSMHNTIERIYAYLNSVHISGELDSLGREKPFFNISIAAANIWMRATDIDRKNIRVKATKSKDWIDSFLATVKLQEWMRRERFGKYLNKWGRVLSRYGSAVTKVTENRSGLHIEVKPWSTMIVDAVDFDNNPKIEVLELTEAQLYQRIDTNGYNAIQVKALCDAITTRENLDKQRKDNKSNYIKLYEVHGKLPLQNLTENEKDDHTYVQQMHVISFVASKKGRQTEYQDFTLVSGREEHDPYSIAHLIEEDDRTLSIGAVEAIFTPQWMQNHSAKSIKDQLDIASKIIFQTSDASFVGQNVLTDLEQGSIFVHRPNEALTKVDNGALDIVSQQNFAVSWKSLSNEINGISEAMLGVAPKAGEAWRQTEAILQENYSLFELMTENKGLYLEQLMRERILPFLKKGFNTSDEVSAILNSYDIDRIDSLYIKNFSVNQVNKAIKELTIKGIPTFQDGQDMMLAKTAADIRETLVRLGDQRFFKPSNISDKTWQQQFADLEWELEIDISGDEARDTKDMLTTLNTALTLIMTPGFEQNKRAQMIVGKILELTGAMSPVEYNAIPAAEPPVAVAPNTQTATPTGNEKLSAVTQ